MFLIKNYLVFYNLLFCSFFAIAYWMHSYFYKYIKKYDFEYEKFKPINLFDAFYFSLITQTTVGYGFTLPETKILKIINTFQLLSIYTVLLINIQYIKKYI